MKFFFPALPIRESFLCLYCMISLFLGLWLLLFLFIIMIMIMIIVLIVMIMKCWGGKKKKIKKIRRRWRTGSVVSDAAGRRPVSRGRFSFVSTRFGSFFDLARPSAIVFFVRFFFFFFVPFSVAYISTKNHHRNNKKEEKETEREEKGRNVRRNRNESKKIIRVSFIHYPSTHR